jgi:hypothetical protein
MKKLLLSALATTSLIFANNAYVDKVLKYYEQATNKLIKFEAKKTKNGYDIFLKSNDIILKKTLKKDAKIHLYVDEGPLITKPSFGFGKAGLFASGDILDIFKDASEVRKDLKDGIKYKYEGKISFGGELEDKLIIKPLKIENDEISLKTSEIKSINSVNLDNLTGSGKIIFDSLILKPKKEKNKLKLSGLKADIKINKAPIQDIFLDYEYNFNIKEFKFDFNTPKQNIKSNFSINAQNISKTKDKKFLDNYAKIVIKANNQDTIALLKGIKEALIEFKIKNGGIDGVIEIQKAIEKLQDIQNKLIEATSKNDDIAMQKAILKQQEYANDMVDGFNKFLIANKTKIITDIELIGLKKSYIKLDLLYKGKELKGDFSSALISLAAQGLGIVDGTFDIAIDSDLATSINPFTPIILDMLKQKGFATLKDGVYYLKGELKDSKVIINNKSYTLQELSKVLF